MRLLRYLSDGQSLRKRIAELLLRNVCRFSRIKCPSEIAGGRVSIVLTQHMVTPTPCPPNHSIESAPEFISLLGQLHADPSRLRKSYHIYNSL